jgi:uncharacterized membrane protein YphA (DoxX/SURF4 family)
MEHRYPWLILRTILGLHFIASGAFNARSWNEYVTFNALLTGPAAAPWFTAALIGLVLAGGLCILTGYRVRAGAVCAFAFLVAATVRHVVAARTVGTMVGPGLTGAHQEAVTQLIDIARRGQLASVAKNIGLIGVVVFVALRGLEPARRPRDHAGS